MAWCAARKLYLTERPMPKNDLDFYKSELRVLLYANKVVVDCNESMDEFLTDVATCICRLQEKNEFLQEQLNEIRSREQNLGFDD